MLNFTTVFGKLQMMCGVRLQTICIGYIICKHLHLVNFVENGGFCYAEMADSGIADEVKADLTSSEEYATTFYPYDLTI
ncbi:MAG: hypothetical protein Q4A49_01120 [Neisseria sp.]|nr:hypothetical protein [Neisseria sp.]